jgi:uncharacterized protein YbbK (DUF523 family)
MKILMSACLLGTCCRYDSCGKEYPQIDRLAEKHEIIPVCPECYGGLPTPREPAERRGERVFSRSGIDVTAKYRRGAEEALRLAKRFGCTLAVMKERSPSCGHGRIYDGTFSGVLTDGDGVTAALLQKNGIRVIGESEIERELLQD